jgi:hypothetical protein
MRARPKAKGQKQARSEPVSKKEKAHHKRATSAHTHRGLGRVVFGRVVKCRDEARLAGLLLAHKEREGLVADFVGRRGLALLPLRCR